MKRWLLWFLLLSGPALPGSEILDRIVITVGRQAITESDISKEIRLSSFLNQAPPDFSQNNRKAAAKRLVERALIRAEMEAGRYPPPKPEEAAPALEAVKKRWSAGGEAFDAALKQYGIREQDLRQYLLEQLAVLRFIDARFGAAVQVFEADLRDYYLRQFLPQWENKSKGPAPAFDDIREDLERILRQQRADVLMDEWLKEMAGRSRIDYRDGSLR